MFHPIPYLPLSSFALDLRSLATSGTQEFRRIPPVSPNKFNGRLPFAHPPFLLCHLYLLSLGNNSTPFTLYPM